MPVAGRKPKENPRNRAEPKHDWTLVRNVAFAGGPRLPRCRPSGKVWPTRTKAWWSAVSTMPHCALWEDSDWSFAIDTAMLAAEFHEGLMSAASELRQREKILGTTGDARRDLRIKYVTATEVAAVEPAGEVEPATVTQLDQYRELYGDDGPGGA